MVGRANPIQAQASVMMLFKALGLHWIAWNPWSWKRRRRCGSCSSTDNPISPEQLLLLLPRLNWGVVCVLQQHGLPGLRKMLISRPYLPAVEQWRSGGESETRWHWTVAGCGGRKNRGSGDLHLGFGLNHTATSHLASVLTALAARS
jgi:hypothetical protein